MNDDPLAALDQLIRGMRDFGRLLWAHYSACVDAGFSPEEAMQLTSSYQALALFNPPAATGEDDE